MKAIIQIEISGDFQGNLSDKEVEDMIRTVVESGAESCCCDGYVKLIDVIES